MPVMLVVRLDQVDNICLINISPEAVCCFCDVKWISMYSKCVKTQHGLGD